jgi:hypothetical protein
MNVFKKIGRGITVLAISPVLALETKEQNRLLEERLNRYQEKRR